MARIKVQRNIDRPLLVKGLSIKFLYVWIAQAGLSFFILLGLILSFTAGSVSFLFLVFMVVMMFFALMVSRVVFGKFSVTKPMKNNNTKIMVSNINLIDLLEKD